jgi:myosin protein heavy chain
MRDELSSTNEKLEKSRKKIQAELEDATIDLEAQRSKVMELEKKQRNFDKILSEEKAISARISEERDNAEREAREKETKLLSMTRALEDSLAQVEELERQKKALQVELEDVVSSQVSFLTCHLKKKSIFVTIISKMEM